MNKRTQRIKELIDQSAKKAADPGLTGTDVQKLQGDTQKMIKKTFKEFIEAVVSKYDAKKVEDKWGPDPSRVTLSAGETYGSKRVQDTIKAAKEKKRKEIEANNEAARKQRESGGIRGTQGGKWGTFKKGVFYPDAAN
jgi:hypothetical protein